MYIITYLRMDWSFNVFVPFKEKCSASAAFSMEDPASTLRVVCWQANVLGLVMEKDGESVRISCVTQRSSWKSVCTHTQFVHNTLFELQQDLPTSWQGIFVEIKHTYHISIWIIATFCFFNASIFCYPFMLRPVATLARQRCILPVAGRSWGSGFYPSLPGPTAWYSGKWPSWRHPIFHWQRWEEEPCDFWSKALRFQNVAPFAVFFLLRYLPSSCAWCITSNVSFLIWYMHIWNFTLYVSLHATCTHEINLQGNARHRAWHSEFLLFLLLGTCGETTRLFAAHEKVLVCTDRWDG